jgi:hypothetical protein
MSSKIRLCGLSLAMMLVSVVGAEDSEQQGDPILSYYCERAGAVFDSRNPVERGADFSFRAKTYFMNIGEHGDVTRVDSSVTDYFYSFGQLDSSRVILAPERSHQPVNFDVVNVFTMDHEFYFFPNDTGGEDLAVGFDSFSEETDDPVGLAVIDRSEFFLRWLHLHYPNREHYKRYSRSFRFVKQDEYIFADSIWEVSAKRGVFSTEFLRTETGITDITINR